MLFIVVGVNERESLRHTLDCGDTVDITEVDGRDDAVSLGIPFPRDDAQWHVVTWRTCALTSASRGLRHLPAVRKAEVVPI